MPSNNYIYKNSNNLSGQSAGRQGRRRCPWRFNAHWVRKEKCEEVIQDGWKSVMAPDCFDRLFGGIEACQLGLRQW